MFLCGSFFLAVPWLSHGLFVTTFSTMASSLSLTTEWRTDPRLLEEGGRCISVVLDFVPGGASRCVCSRFSDPCEFRREAKCLCRLRARKTDLVWKRDDDDEDDDDDDEVRMRTLDVHMVPIFQCTG